MTEITLDESVSAELTEAIDDVLEAGGGYISIQCPGFEIFLEVGLHGRFNGYIIDTSGG